MKFLFKGVLVLLVVAVVAVVGFVLLDGRGEIEQDSIIQGVELPGEWVSKGEENRKKASENIGAPPQKQILFGDLHVHSTFSTDAFFWSLPMMNGEGTHPPADACDYARYCSNLDFWSLTDHAENLAPRHWTMIKDMVRQCNAVTDPADPDLVTFLGWEWSQVGQTPDDHYGHRNVVLLETAEDKVPARPIASGGVAARAASQSPGNLLEQTVGPYLIDFENREILKQMFAKQTELAALTPCPEGVHVKDLPADCVESAATPEMLWKKLDQWGGEALAIPHGTAWGFYTPPGVKWDKQLTNAHNNPGYQKLIEVMSGHGSSEEYRDWRAVEYDDQGAKMCPSPTKDYLPCCHRAGELIADRCDDPESAACQMLVDKAEMDYLNASVAGHLVVPDVKAEQWLNCGQCTDCFLPALNYRPGNSAQYIMAQSNFDEPVTNAAGEQKPQRFRLGFIASSDNHAAQPGTGYKEVDRHMSTEAFGAVGDSVRQTFTDPAKRKEYGKESIPFDPQNTNFNLLQYAESERQGSYFYTGGLVAAHSTGRDRQSVWGALQRKEVYGTSGDRILLWFDLLKGAREALPMGSEISTKLTPRFRVRAIGAFEQKPGCPAAWHRCLGRRPPELYVRW